MCGGARGGERIVYTKCTLSSFRGHASESAEKNMFKQILTSKFKNISGHCLSFAKNFTNIPGNTGVRLRMRILKFKLEFKFNLNFNFNFNIKPLNL